jgi:PAS domain S-box-containing protein
MNEKGIRLFDQNEALPEPIGRHKRADCTHSLSGIVGKALDHRKGIAWLLRQSRRGNASLRRILPGQIPKNLPSTQTDSPVARAKKTGPTETCSEQEGFPIVGIGVSAGRLEVHQIELELQNEELRRTRLALQTAVDRYVELYDFSPAGHLTLDQKRVIQEANLRAGTLLGIPRGELIRQPIIKFIAPNGQGVFARHLQDAFRTGARQSCDLPLFQPGGATPVIHLESQAFPDEKGPQTYCRIALFDITERKHAEEVRHKSEERLRAIMDNSPALIFLKDLEGRYVQINRRLEEVFHLASRNIIGKTDEEIFSPEQAAAFRANDRKVLEAGVATEFEEVALHDDGPHTSIVLKFPLLNAQGQPYALCGIVTDITERRRAEKQLQETVDRVRTLSQRLNAVREEERTRIARELHDELGVRLTCLKLDLARLQSSNGKSLLTSGKRGEKIRSMITEVDATIASVQRLMADLRPGILDDLGLVAAIEWQCQDFERRSGIRCLCEATQEQIILDPSCATAAFRICQETLTNVMRHANATFVRVLMTQVNGDLLLEIQDDGRGISAEKLTDSASLGHLGMRERASSLEGQVEIAGWPGKGTNVTLGLPIAATKSRSRIESSK